MKVKHGLRKLQLKREIVSVCHTCSAPIIYVKTLHIRVICNVTISYNI